MITKEEKAKWREMEVTKKLLERLNEEVDEMKTMWVEGRFTSLDVSDAEARGYVRCAIALIEWSHNEDDTIEEVNIDNE